MIIDSKNNTLIKYINKLNCSRDFRQQEGKFFVEGLRFVAELLNENWTVYRLLVTEQFKNNSKFGELNLHPEIKVAEVSEQIMGFITDTQNPQGIAAVVCKKQFRFQDIAVSINGSAATEGQEVAVLNRPADGHMSALKNLLIIVDGVQDPGNLGTIIRTADAAGAGGVLITKGSVDAFNGKTLRSTVGSIFHLPVIQNCQWHELAALLQTNGWQVVAADPRAKQNIYDCDLRLPCAVVIGNEANGLSPEAAKMVDCLLSIPMPGRSESLNASVAAAIFIYEVIRQQLKK